MHFPFDHSSHFKCICTNSMSGVGKNIGNALFLVQREGVWRRAPCPSQHQSRASPLACCAQPSTTSGWSSTPGHCFFANPHPVSFKHKHPAHCSGKSPSEGCTVLVSPPTRLAHVCQVSLHSCCPAPSRCHHRESCTPAKLH